MSIQLTKLFCLPLVLAATTISTVRAEPAPTKESPSHPYTVYTNGCSRSPWYARQFDDMESACRAAVRLREDYLRVVVLEGTVPPGEQTDADASVVRRVELGYRGPDLTDMTCTVHLVTETAVHRIASKALTPEQAGVIAVDLGKTTENVVVVHTPKRLE